MGSDIQQLYCISSVFFDPTDKTYNPKDPSVQRNVHHPWINSMSDRRVHLQCFTSTWLEIAEETDLNVAVVNG